MRGLPNFRTTSRQYLATLFNTDSHVQEKAPKSLTKHKPGLSDPPKALRLNVNVRDESPATEDGHVESLLVCCLHSSDVHWDDSSLDYLEGSIHHIEIFTVYRREEGEGGGGGGEKKSYVNLVEQFSVFQLSI